MDEEDKHSPSEFYYPEDLETFDVETETGITECHIINNFTNRACSGSQGPYCHGRVPIFPSTALALG